MHGAGEEHARGEAVSLGIPTPPPKKEACVGTAWLKTAGFGLGVELLS